MGTAKLGCKLGCLVGLALLGVAASAVQAGEAVPAALRVYGNTTTIELAPVLLAAQTAGPAAVTVTNGGVPDLFKPDAAQLATNAETQALRVTVDNPDLRIILTVSEGLYRIVARRSAGITKLADLKGKRVATIGATSSGYFLHRMLQTVGLTDRDVTVVPVTPLSRMADALEKREVDAVTIWEPEMQHAIDRIGDDAIEFSGRGVYRELFNLNTTAQQLADPVQRPRIVAFVRSVLVATKQLHADPAGAWGLVARSSRYDEATVARTWHHHAYPGTLVPDLLDVLEAEEVWSARERNRTPRTRAQLAVLVDDSVLKEVLAAEPALRVHPPTPEHVRAQTDALRVARLSAGVRQASAIRQIKRVQHALNQYRAAGRWSDAAQLFTRNATARFADGEVSGRAAIQKHFEAESGAGRGPLRDGDLNEHLIISPVVSFDADGGRARGRWHELSMTGQYGKSANWAGGIHENEYAEEGGVWKIARLHYYPSFLGPYSPGWRNADKSDKVTVVPFHYTPDRAGTPVSPAALLRNADRAGAGAGRVRELRAQLAQLRDETLVRNIQNAYGFYFDRRMWDDVVDLFAPDATIELAQRGVYAGRDGIRRALEQIGPLNLAVGVINDHLQLQPVVTVAPDGMTATARGTELALTGQNGADAWWGVNTWQNEYVKRDGKWMLKAVHVFERLRTDYYQGWARSALPIDTAPKGAAPDHPPSVLYAAYPKFFSAPIRYPNPARSEPRPHRAESRPAAGDTLDSLLVAAQRELDGVVAVDGSENVSNAYGYYIDEFLWDNTADVFSLNGSKELSYIGNYVGRERIRASLFARYGSGGRRATGMTLHQKTQPYVTVAPDGRSARIRERLFQLNSAREADGSYISGIYENNTVRENGVWRISRMDLDYAWTSSYANGWARVAENANRQFAPAAPNISVLPDGPLRGVTIAPFPQLATMAFHFRNPVSGRDPPELLPP